MRTIPLGSVFYRYLQLTGQDKANIADGDFQQFVDFCSSRMDLVWNQDDWPELIRYAEIATTQNGDGSITATVPADAEDVLETYAKDPRTTTVNRALQWFLTETDTTRYINFIQAPATAWVVYKKARTPLQCQPYSASTAYAVGAQIWFNEGSTNGSYVQSAAAAPSGNVYVCAVATSAGENPTSTPAKWTKVEIPAFLSEYLARGCVADYLKSEGLYAQAASAEQDAEYARQQEVDRVIRVQGQTNRLNVYTY
jgi:hypothetical protein